MKKFSWKQAVIILAIVVVFILGVVYYVKYESVLNSLVAVFSYVLGAVSGAYLMRFYLTKIKK